MSSGMEERNGDRAIQFVDIAEQYTRIKPEIEEAIARVIESARFIGGEEVEKFEEEFAAFCEAKHAIAVSSGTAALELIHWALDIGEGDEVIVPVNTYISTAFAASNRGARVRFADCDPRSYNIDVRALESLITLKTKAISAVHLYGQSADIDEIMALAESHKLSVIEDACQSHGARYKGQRVGTFGIASAFSFYPGKNLGAYGDGGAVVTNDAAFAARIRELREYGQKEKYVHVTAGTNARLDALQAAILRVKLKHLDAWNAQRRERADVYNKALADTPVQLPEILSERDHVFHVYAVELDERDALMSYLREKGIQSNMHYPIPLHLQGAYAHLGYAEDDFPAAEAAAKRLVSLPMYPELTEDDINYVAEHIRGFFNHVGR